MNFLIVVPTLGRRQQIGKLIRSIAAQHSDEVEIIIVNQGESASIAAQLVGLGTDDVRVLQTTPGVSRARNVGIVCSRSDWDVVGFIDDDCRYGEDVFRAVEAVFHEGADACSTRIVTDDDHRSSRVPFGQHKLWLNERTVWTHAMESGSFFGRDYIDKVGLFDEDLGLGAESPWQSGEGTDLLLRGLQKGYRIAYLPNAIVWEDPMPSLQHSEGMIRMRRYARGTGRVMSRRMNVAGQVLFLLRSVAKVLLGLRRLSIQRTLLDIQVLIGRLEGLSGRVISW